MKIAIDARNIREGRAGREQYSYNLISSLIKVDRINKYVLYTNPDFRWDNLPVNFMERFIPIKGILWHLLVLIDLAFTTRVDIYIALGSPIVTAFTKTKCVCVIHDLISFLRIAKLPLKSYIVERLLYKIALMKAKKVIAVSKNTKRDIIKLLKIPDGKIAVIPEGVSENFTPSSALATLKKYNVPEKFILFVGTLEPRKNIVRLIKAYSRIGESYRKQYKLVIVGKKGWYYKEIFKTAKELSLYEDVIFTGYIPDEKLTSFYSVASVLVYPSLYEGFGLPILEAMACGTPVIASKGSSTQEITGGAALLVDPMDVAKITGAMKEIILDKNLRESLIKKGLKRAKSFSWDKTAEKIKEVCEKYV